MRLSGQAVNMMASYDLQEALAQLPLDENMSMSSSSLLVKQRALGYALNDFDDSYSASDYQEGQINQRRRTQSLAPTLQIMEQMSPTEQVHGEALAVSTE